MERSYDLDASNYRSSASASCREARVYREAYPVEILRHLKGIGNKFPAINQTLARPHLDPSIAARSAPALDTDLLRSVAIDPVAGGPSSGLGKQAGYAAACATSVDRSVPMFV